MTLIILTVYMLFSNIYCRNDIVTQSETLHYDEVASLQSESEDDDSLTISKDQTDGDQSGNAGSWAWHNDGTFCYEDNAGSAFGDPETVCAVEGTDINVEGLKNRNLGISKDIIVAVIDTGIDIDHEDLKDMLWKNTGEIPGDGIDNDDNGFVDDVNGWNFYGNNSKMYNTGNYSEDAHGTHIAGIINRTVKEVFDMPASGPKISIMPVKSVGGPDNTGTVSSIIKGIQYAKANGADICNISLSFKKWNDNLYNTIKDSGMLFVVAAGNGESDTVGTGFELYDTKRYPACYGLDNVIVAANMRCDGKLHYSSNYSKKFVDIAAPGTKIWSTSTVRAGYEYMTGTSMAAPFIAGAVACVSAVHGDWDIYDIKDSICNTARKLPDLEDYIRTGGMLDLTAAVDYDPTVTQAPTSTPAETTSPAPTTGVTPTEVPQTTTSPDDPETATKEPEITVTPTAGVTPTEVPQTTTSPDDPETATKEPVITVTPTVTATPENTLTTMTTAQPDGSGSTTKESSTSSPSKAVKVEKGAIYTAGKGQTKARYLVKNVKKRRVYYYRCLVGKKVKTAIVPKKIRLRDGKFYKITGIDKKAFKGLKIKRKIKAKI